MQRGDDDVTDVSDSSKPPVHSQTRSASCELRRFAVDDPAAAIAARDAPIILTGWQAPQNWDEKSFMHRHGWRPQVKPVPRKVEADTGLTNTLLRDSEANVTTAGERSIQINNFCDRARVAGR